MPTPFSSQDLGRIFDARTLTRGRSLGLAGGVEVQLDGDTITGIVQDRAVTHTVSITPSLLGRRVVFDHRCTCRSPAARIWRRRRSRRSTAFPRCASRNSRPSSTR